MKSDKVPVPSQVQERVLPEARCDDTAVPRVPDSPHTAPPSSPPCSQRGPCTRCPGHSRLLPPGHWHPVLHPRRRAVAGVVTAETGQVSAAAGGIWRRQPTSQLTAGLQSLHGGWSRHAQGQSWAEGVGWLGRPPLTPGGPTSYCLSCYHLVLATISLHPTCCNDLLCFYPCCVRLFSV